MRAGIAENSERKEERVATREPRLPLIEIRRCRPLAEDAASYVSDAFVQGRWRLLRGGVLAVRKEEALDKLYLSVKEAAEYVGIGEKAMRDYVNSKDPPPHMKSGSKYLLQKAALEPYFEQRQEVRL